MRLLQWHLVFADIVNNKTEILYWHCRLNLIYMPDCRHLIIPMTWLYTWHPIGHLILYWLALLLSIHVLYVISVLFQYIYFLYLLTCYLHMHFPVYSYTFTRSSDFLDLHIQICGYLLLTRHWEMITGIWRNPEFSLLDSPVSVSFLLFFIPVVLMILCIGSVFALFLYLSGICVDISM